MVWGLIWRVGGCGLMGVLMGLLPAGPAMAEAPGAEALRQAQAKPEAARAMAEDGRKAAFFCANCHGDAGHSKYPEVPNLAGQNPAYLLVQVDAFLSGKRKDPFMQGLMKVLSDRDKVAIALFYGTAPTQPASPTPGPRAAEGAKYFERLCARCHQADARGGETFPRLAGQQPEYIRRNLKRYLTLSGERFYGPMTAATMQLGDKNIEAMVDYLSSLN